uniref:phosphatidate cytidylyltransferase n=1 Tax=Echinostoma caproni TaxID=27848 RepID=A0A183BB61_9TREM
LWPYSEEPEDDLRPYLDAANKLNKRTAHVPASTFILLVYLGRLALALLVLFLQITIGYVVYQSYDLPFLLFQDFLQALVIISCYSFCTRVSSWYSMWSRNIISSSFYSRILSSTIFSMVSFGFYPVSLVICNDIVAYVCGFFFGNTPLIKLSSKKTCEGFIGGGLATVVFGFVLALIIIRYYYFVCLLEWNDTEGCLTAECTRNSVFVPRTYYVSNWPFMVPFRQFNWYPFLCHVLVTATYSSVFRPFGGFFSSGFKRAFKTCPTISISVPLHHLFSDLLAAVSCITVQLMNPGELMASQQLFRSALLGFSPSTHFYDEKKPASLEWVPHFVF